MANKISTLLTDLAACLCVGLDDSPALCWCGVIPGTGVVAEMGFGCGTESGDPCGVAWVRLGNSYPAAAIGEISRNEGCGEFLGLDIEVGVLRCVPVAGEDGVSMPGRAEQEAMFMQQMEDLSIMRKAISCCPALSHLGYRLGTYQPAGPLGGLLGGVFTVSTLV